MITDATTARRPPLDVVRDDAWRGVRRWFTGCAVVGTVAAVLYVAAERHPWARSFAAVAGCLTIGCATQLVRAVWLWRRPTRLPVLDFTDRVHFGADHAWLAPDDRPDMVLWDHGGYALMTPTAARALLADSADHPLALAARQAVWSGSPVLYETMSGHVRVYDHSGRASA